MKTPLHRRRSVAAFRLLTVALVAGGFAVPAARVATAQVTFFGAQKTGFYTQTADNTAPATAGNYSEFGFVNTQNASDADSFTLAESATNAAIALTSSTAAPTNFGGSNFYATKAALDADFAAGDLYTFTAFGGTLDGQTDSLPIGTDAYPALLYLSGSGFSNAMAVDPNSSFTFTLASSGGDAAATALAFSLSDASGAQVYFANLAAGTTSITVPQSVIDSLTAGQPYTATLNNFNTSNVAIPNGFGSPSNSDGFVTTTSFGFEVVPEPRSVILLCAGLAALIGGRMVRRRGVTPLPPR